jgi:hypothetical protein
MNNTLANTNPHIRDPKARAEAICRSVENSSAIEGIDVDVKAYKVNGRYQFKAIVKAPA